jgi:hypothetical protein
VTVAGLPLHPLIVHAAVVFTPLASLLVIGFAVLPNWRWLTRWPSVLVTLVALVSVFLARQSGQSLLSSRPALAQLTAVQTHEHRGKILCLLMAGFMVLTLLGAFTLGGQSLLASGRGQQDRRTVVLDRLMPLLLVAGALVVLVWVVLTGEAGARAVWG